MEKRLKTKVVDPKVLISTSVPRSVKNAYLEECKRRNLSLYDLASQAIQQASFLRNYPEIRNPRTAVVAVD
jgi:hypothetical protein